LTDFRHRWSRTSQHTEVLSALWQCSLWEFLLHSRENCFPKMVPLRLCGIYFAFKTKSLSPMPRLFSFLTSGSLRSCSALLQFVLRSLKKMQHMKHYHNCHGVNAQLRRSEEPALGKLQTLRHTAAVGNLCWMPWRCNSVAFQNTSWNASTCSECEIVTPISQRQSQKSHAHVCIQQWTLKDTARLKQISTLGSTHWRWRESQLLHRHDCTLHQKLILHKVLTDKQFQLIPPRPSHVWLLEKLWSSGDKSLCWRLLVPVWVWFDMPTRKLKEWSAFTLRSGLIIESNSSRQVENYMLTCSKTNSQNITTRIDLVTCETPWALVRKKTSSQWHLFDVSWCDLSTSQNYSFTVARIEVSVFGYMATSTDDMSENNILDLRG
jgi:hypothetical protein